MEESRIHLSGIYLSANGWKKRVERIDGCSIAVYEKLGKEIRYDGCHWTINGTNIFFTDEIPPSTNP